jgi:predicted nucleotidyltransferase
MDKNDILRVIRRHEPELKAVGIERLRLFGSVARDEHTPQSDVDLLFDCEEDDTFRIPLRIMGSEDELRTLLGMRIHLTAEKYLRPKLRQRVLGDAVEVFKIDRNVTCRHRSQHREHSSICHRPDASGLSGKSSDTVCGWNARCRSSLKLLSVSETKPRSFAPVSTGETYAAWETFSGTNMST